MSEQKKMVCAFNLRPRVAGVAMLIEAGTPFTEDMVDDESKKMMMDKGDLWYEGERPVAAEEAPANAPAEAPGAPAKPPTLKEMKEEAKKLYGVVLTGKAFNSKKKVADEMARLKEANAPKGHFREDPDDLKEFSLDELDALHTEICAANGLPAPASFESVEQGIAKLTGEAE